MKVHLAIALMINQTYIEQQKQHRFSDTALRILILFRHPHFFFAVNLIFRHNQAANQCE